MMPNHGSTVPLNSFAGLNNVLDAKSTPINFLKKAENIDIDKSGKIQKRKGYSLVNSGNYKSIWANESGNKCYAIKDNNLVKVLEDYSTILLKSNINEEVSFEEVNDIVYYISPNNKGIIENDIVRSFGLEINNLAPALTVTNGNLEPGTYQVGFTYVATNGLESGVSITSTITLSTKSGIQLYIPTPTNLDIAYARIYCSTRDGIELYYNGISVLNSNYTISDQRESISILRTFNLFPPPNGSIIKWYKGRLYIAQDNILWYSEPFQYEYFKLDSNYIEFPDIIREVIVVDDGIWIGSDNLYYLTGSDPDKFNLSNKENFQIIKGTATKISGSYLQIDKTPIGYKWLVTTNQGIVALYNQGVVINLTSKFLAINQADSGMSTFIQDNGMNNYLSVLKSNSNPNNSVMGDLVESQIIRNGVVIT